MITAVVQFALSHPVTLEEATKMFESTAPKYKNLPGLVRKYYLRSEDGGKAGGVYLWAQHGRRLGGGSPPASWS